MTAVAKALEAIFSSIDHCLPSFNYVFTKFSADVAGIVPEFIKKKLRELTPDEEANPAIVALLQDMKTKTEHHAFVVHPLKTKALDLLEKFVSTPALTNPGELFRDFVTPRSAEALRNYLSKTTTAIRVQVDATEPNIALIKYKLDQLKQLSLRIHLHDVKKAYEECVFEIVSMLTARVNEFHEVLRRLEDDRMEHFHGDLAVLVIAALKLRKYEELRKLHCQTLAEAGAGKYKREHIAAVSEPYEGFCNFRVAAVARKLRDKFVAEVNDSCRLTRRAC